MERSTNTSRPNVLEYLQELVQLTGPSGVEEDVIRAIVRLARPLSDAVEIDAFGNVFATRQAPDPDARRLVLATHMDEIGFRVRKIEENGFLRFEKVGGTDNRILLAQRVWINTAGGRIQGAIGTKSAHLLTDDDRTSVPRHIDLYIDVGARSADEARGMGIRLGAGVGFVGELVSIGKDTGRYIGHALDDRAGCAVALALLDRLRDRVPPVTVTAIFTVQEEVGLRGARAAQDHPADVAIAIDTTAVDDTPDTGTSYLRLGAGPAIKIMDASQLAHPAVQAGMRLAAEWAGVAVQEEVLMGIGTDAGALQFGGSGTPAGTLSIGTRYTHSPVEELDLADLAGAVDLLDAFVSLMPTMNMRFLSEPPE